MKTIVRAQAYRILFALFTVASCALVVEALPFRPCFASGESEALVSIFRDGIREPRIVVATPPAGRLAVESVYRFERVEKMHRMAVSVATFRPRPTHSVRRLGPEQLDDVIDLYGHASRTYFTEARLEREIYFGVYVGTTLVSAAGTHVRSRLSNIAAVGNVLTRIAYRDQHVAGAHSHGTTAQFLIAVNAELVYALRLSLALAGYAPLGISE